MKELICSVCPMGCHLSCTKKDGQIDVSGNNCARGREFAISELTFPTRVLTALVHTKNGDVVSVKTTKPIDKNLIFEAMAQLDKIVVQNPKFGQILVKNFLNTGADVVVTKNM